MKAIGNRKTSARHLTRDYARVFYLAEGVSNKAYQAYELIGGDHTLIYVADATLGNLMVTRMVGTDHQYLLHTSIHDGACKEYSLKILDSVKRYGELKFVRIINTSAALTPLFVARGAVYNATTGYYELNGLTDITEAQMIDIYQQTGCIYNPSENYFANAYSSANRVSFRTNFQMTITDGAPFAQLVFAPNVEVYNLGLDNYKLMLSNSYIAYRAPKLRSIGGIINCINAKTIYTSDNLSKLESIKLYNLRVNLSLSSCALLSYDSVNYLITEATNTKPITVTVNSAVYAKLTDPTNAEWYAINTMAVAKNIAFAQ